MPKSVPAITGVIDWSPRSVAIPSSYGLQGPAIWCLDLERVPEKVRMEAVKALALGAQVARRGANSVHFDGGKLTRRTWPTIEVIFGILAFLLVVLGPPFLLAINDSSRPVSWVIYVMAGLGTLAGMAVWHWRSVKVVDINDAVVAFQAIEAVHPTRQKLIGDTQNILRDILREAPEAMTDEAWMLGYRIQADLAAINKMEREGMARALQQPVLDRINSDHRDLTDFFASAVLLPERQRKAAAERARKAEVEKSLAPYLDFEAAQRQEALMVTKGAEPTGNYLDLEPTAPGFPDAPTWR